MIKKIDYGEYDKEEDTNDDENNNTDNHEYNEMDEN